VSNWQIVFTTIVAILATARITRLIVEDEYPPSIWVRIKWDRLTRDGEWAKLVHCGWCASPYVAALVLGLGYFLTWPTWWYVACSWLAASYAAGWVVFHDED
jgi:hypothetical protein